MKRPVSLLIAAIILVGLGLLLIPQADQKESKKLASLDFLPPNEVAQDDGKDNKLIGPHQAALQNFEMTMDPALGYPPTQRKVNTFLRMQEEAQKTRFASESAIPGVEWVERGSDNIGGRTRALMFDPQDQTAKKVWAGSTGGGLWFNNDITDIRSSWQNVPGLMDNLTISSITYDPTDNSIFYIGTGLAFSGISDGDGIWKSTDSGVSWSQLNSTANGAFGAIQDIKITSAGTVLAATMEGFIRSTDGGTSWTTITNGEFADIEIAANGDIYTATSVNGSGNLFKSTDDGQNLTDITPQSGGERIEIAVAPSNANVIYAVAEGGSGNQDVEWFKRSDDGGETWTDLTIPLQITINQQTGDCESGPSHFTRGQAFFDLILAVHPTDENIIIAGGVDLHKSSNAGEDWEAVSYWTGSNCQDYVHADQHAIVFRPGFPNQAIFGNDGGIDYSADIGSAANPDFERRIKGYNTVMFYSVAMVNQPGSNVMIAGAQDNGTQRFTTPGMNSTRDVFGGDGTLTFIDQTNAGIQITSFVFNFIGWSNNGGLSFTTIENDQNSGRFVNPADYDPNQGIYYSAGASNQIKRIQGLKQSPEDQETLTLALNGGQISSIKVSPHTANRVFIGTGSGSIFRLDNANMAIPTVTAITGSSDGNPGNFVSGIDIGASDEQIMITYSNFGVTSVYETTNGGTNWTSKEGDLPDIPVRDALYNPDNRSQVLLATELGVWSTTEFDTANPNWEATNSGLASVRVDKLEYRGTDKLVAAATHGRGIFTSNVFAQTSIADFRSSAIVGYAGVPIDFIDASSANGGDFSWDFGDGNTSTDQHPTHTFTNPGTYDVSLSVNSGAATETKTDYITILPVKPVPYTLVDGGDFESNPDDFTSTAFINGINIWERGVPGGTLNTPNSGTNAWKTRLTTNLTDLGYDYGSALYTPAFDLSDPAKDYTLKFRRSGSTRFCNAPMGLYVEYSLDGGKSWKALGTSMEEAGQVNWYNRGPNFGCFLDRDISPTLEGWSEGNGTNVNVDTQIKLNNLIGSANVSFRFVATVVGAIGGGYDQDGFMIDDFEVEAVDATADFTASPTVVGINKEVQFQYASNGAETFVWDFGDGSTSNEENPSHSYASSGSFTVALTITSNGNSVTETKTDFIKVINSINTPYLLTDGGDFESNQSDFTAINEAGTPFELGSSSVAGKNGTASGSSAWVTGINETVYANDSRASLVSPAFIFDQAKEYTLEFKANFSFESEWDGFIVEYSTDLGETYTKLNNNVESDWYTQTSNAQSVLGGSTPIFSGNTGGSYQTFSTDVSFLYPNDNVLFRFLFLSDVNIQDAGVAIDDFQILVQDPVPPTADFTASATIGCSGQTITFTNTSTGSVKTYEWDFGANASPATATGVGPHDVTYTGAGTSTVSLRTINDFGGEDTETKTDLITTSATHTPTIVRGETNDPEVISLTASTGDSYQWFRNSTVIDGATNQVLETDENGLYTVEVTINGCAVRATALNVVILVTGLEDDIVFSKTVNIFPNPVKNELNIGISNEVMGQHGINFYNAAGLLIRQENELKDETDETFTFDIANMPEGNYLVQIISPKGVTVKKVIKQ
ncbi:MAG: PKD domain-containing protein [Roseivirga sp.]|nr:PKD domain-containing protein [Roseivirga sp.]